MTNLPKIVISSLSLIAILLGLAPAWTQNHDPSCLLIQQALTDYSRVKVGVTRAEVEKNFTLEGGAQFPSTSRYVYSKCGYLHVDIEFDAKGTIKKGLFSPDDVVTRASKLYIDYSARD